MNKRDKVIDVAKGIGIILVILAHVLKGKNIFVLEVIYYFHMPLFFFISGLLSYYDKSNNFKEFLLKKFKSIIIPYIVFSIISFMYWALIERKLRNQMDVSLLENFLNIFIFRVDENKYIYNIVLWFLPCLFVSEIILYVYRKMTNIIGMLISLINLSIGLILAKSSLIFPFALETALIASFFMYIGFLYKKFNLQISNINKKILALMFILSNIIIIISNSLNLKVNMLNHEYSNIYLFILASFSGITIIFLLSNKIRNNKILNFLGKNSLMLMCLHEPLKRFIIKLWSIIFKISIDVIRCNLLLSLILTIIIICFILPIIVVKNKYKIKNYQVKI